jgi:4-hydroxybenzoate polyprenyltransferase
MAYQPFLRERAIPVIDDQLSEGPMKPLPLVVDLDGTLVKTNVLVESLFALIKQNSLYVFLLPFWLIKGKAFFKRQVSQRVPLDADVLPYNRKFVDYLRDQRERGRRLILTTGADERMARQVADHLQLFDMTLASDGTTNLSGPSKRGRLVKEFGERGFDYAGDASRDLVVWSSAHRVILVNPTEGLSRRAARVATIEQVFGDQKKGVRPYIQALRLHHWLKNLLVFVPLTLAYRLSEFDLLGNACLAFLAFGLCASSIYLINDLVDLPADRHHPRKHERPFAAGQLSLFWGLVSVPLLLGFSLLVSLQLPWPFLGMLVIYFLLNLGYSFTLKRIVLLDVIILAGLYTMRIMAGSAAVSIWPSSWLLAFSTFLFLSLALVKRYAELVIMGTETEVAQVRGYRIVDKELLASMGAGSGYVAVLVLAMYISSGTAEIHYTRQHLIWLLCPLLLYWISYVWLIAHRGAMHDDPLVFTLRDPVSRIVMILAAVVLALAR